MGIGLMGTMCEMAHKQGTDLYGADGKRSLLAEQSPEGGGGDHGTDSDGFDELGFGTLAYVLEACGA